MKVLTMNGKVYDLGSGSGCLRWCNAGDVFHVDRIVRDGEEFFRVFVPSQSEPTDINSGAHEVCPRCGK